MSSAMQLFFHDIQSSPLIRYEQYVENMRQVRGYPDWWRIRDDIAFIDGPRETGEQYTRDTYIWRVEIVKDEEGENSDTFELNNPTAGTIAVETYTHTDVIDSVSLEFDSSGRRSVAFESAGNVFLLWYDPQESETVVTDFGPGYNPIITTDTYRRLFGSGDSERLLFYVDGDTNQIVYRRQLDRYGVEYTLPDAPADIVELLKVSKNLYGGLTALYCYDVDGELVVGSFTARAGEDQVALGTDYNILDRLSISGAFGEIQDFALRFAEVPAAASDSESISVVAGEILEFSLREPIVELSQQDSESAQPASGSILDFELKVSLMPIDAEVDSISAVPTSGDIEDFMLMVALINISSDGADTANATAGSGNLIDFFLG